MEKTSVLQLEWRGRAGGGGKTRREYLDFVVDGQPLSEKFGGDMVSCLGWFTREEHLKAVRRLLLQEPADLPNNRRSLYVCPECGDLGCGALTVVVERVVDRIVWRDFGYQRDPDEFMPVRDHAGVSFAFERAQYNQAIKSAL